MGNVMLWVVRLRSSIYIVKELKILIFERYETVHHFITFQNDKSAFEVHQLGFSDSSANHVLLKSLFDFVQEGRVFDKNITLSINERFLKVFLIQYLYFFKLKYLASKLLDVATRCFVLEVTFSVIFTKSYQVFSFLFAISVRPVITLN